MTGVSSQPEGAISASEPEVVHETGHGSDGISRRDLVKIGAVATAGAAGAAFLGGLPIFSSLVKAQSESDSASEGRLDGSGD